METLHYIQFYGVIRPLLQSFLNLNTYYIHYDKLMIIIIMKIYLIGNWKWRRWFPQRVHEKTYARNGGGLSYQQKTFWSCFWLNQRGPVSSHSRSPRLVLKCNVKNCGRKKQDRSKSRIAKVKEFLYHIRNLSIK